MANQGSKTALDTYINENIEPENHANKITGQKHNDVEHAIVDTLIAILSPAPPFTFSFTNANLTGEDRYVDITHALGKATIKITLFDPDGFELSATDVKRKKIDNNRVRFYLYNEITGTYTGTIE